MFRYDGSGSAKAQTASTDTTQWRAILDATAGQQPRVDRAGNRGRQAEEFSPPREHPGSIAAGVAVRGYEPKAAAMSNEERTPVGCPLAESTTMRCSSRCLVMSRAAYSSGSVDPMVTISVYPTHSPA
jgi:hypothetical protein